MIEIGNFFFPKGVIKYFGYTKGKEIRDTGAVGVYGAPEIEEYNVWNIMLYNISPTTGQPVVLGTIRCEDEANFKESIEILKKEVK